MNEKSEESYILALSYKCHKKYVEMLIPEEIHDELIELLDDNETVSGLLASLIHKEKLIREYRRLQNHGRN